MNYQSSENKSTRKVKDNVSNSIIILIYTALLLPLLMSLVNFGRISSEINLKIKEFKENIQAPNPLLLSRCVPQNVNTTYRNDYPISFDWRNERAVGKVIDQLLCNVCWAVSIIGVMESMVAIEQIRRGDFNGVESLSIQEMIDCSLRRGCVLGDPRLVLNDMMDRQMSIVTEREYPLTLRWQDCKIPAKNQPKGVKVKGFEVACNLKPEEIMYRIYHHGPVAVAVNSYQWILYTGGIITRNCPNETMSNHIAQIVGYDRSGEIPYYIVKNSWGVDFGIDGYLKIEMGEGKNLCGIQDYVVSIDVS